MNQNTPFKIAKTRKSFTEAVEAVCNAAKRNSFNVVHIHNLHEIYKKNGLESNPYSIIEICNPQKSHYALSLDLRMGAMMPKSIQVFVDENDETNIMFRKVDSSKFDEWFPEKNISELSIKVMQVLQKIVDEAV